MGTRRPHWFHTKHNAFKSRSQSWGEVGPETPFDIPGGRMHILCGARCRRCGQSRRQLLAPRNSIGLWEAGLVRWASVRARTSPGWWVRPTTSPASLLLCRFLTTRSAGGIFKIGARCRLSGQSRSPFLAPSITAGLCWWWHEAPAFGAGAFRRLRATFIISNIGLEPSGAGLPNDEESRPPTESTEGSTILAGSRPKMRTDWERPTRPNGTERSPGNLGPSPADSTIPDSRQREFQDKDTTSQENVKRPGRPEERPSTWI